jgi:hypothetical protein
MMCPPLGHNDPVRILPQLAGVWCRRSLGLVAAWRSWRQHSFSAWPTVQLARRSQQGSPVTARSRSSSVGWE